MDCCAHEGGAAGDAKFDIEKVADGIGGGPARPGIRFLAWLARPPLRGAPRHAAH